MTLLFWCNLVKGEMTDAAQHVKPYIHPALMIIFIVKNLRNYDDE